MIHQTAKSKDLTGYMFDSRRSILEHNPGCEYKLWDDADLKELVDEKFPALAKVWKSLKGIQKADLGRYAVLHEYGGFYADTDIVAKGRFVPKNPDVLNLAYSIKVMPWSRSTSTNFFMYSPAKNPVLLKIIEEGVRRVQGKRRADVPYSTGRALIQDVLKKEKTAHAVFDDNKVFNKFCYNSELPETAFAVHDGSTSARNRKSWVPDARLNFVNSECALKKGLGMDERNTQFPYVLSSFLFIVLLLFVGGVAAGIILAH